MSHILQTINRNSNIQSNDYTQTPFHTKFCIYRFLWFILPFRQVIHPNSPRTDGLHIRKIESWKEVADFSSSEYGKAIWCPIQCKKTHFIAIQDKRIEMWNWTHLDHEFKAESEVMDLMWSPTDSNIFAYSTNNGLINFFDIRASEVIIKYASLATSIPGICHIKWNTQESVYFSARSVNEIALFDLSQDDPFCKITDNVISYDWHGSDEIVYITKDGMLKIYNIHTKEIREKPTNNTWIHTYKPDVLVGIEKNRLNFFDLQSMNTINTIEAKDNIHLFVNRTENQFITWSSEINLYTFELSDQFLDDEVSFTGEFNSLDMSKRNLTENIPSPVTSASRFSFNGELYYFTGGIDTDSKSLRDFQISVSKKDTYHDLNYFSNFFIEEKEQENEKTIRRDVQVFDLKNIIGFDRELAQDLKYDPEWNLKILEKRLMKSDVKLWNLINILRKNRMKGVVFDKTLDSV